MTQPLHVLILEDRPADAELILVQLRKAGYAVQSRRVEREAEFMAALEEDVDVILADYTLPTFGVPRALQLLKQRDADIPFIVVTGSLGDEAAAACIKLGATDYLLKDRLARLPEAVAHALQERRSREDRRIAEQAVRDSEERLRLMFESLRDYAIFMLDSAGKIISWNAGAERIQGYAAHEIIGKHFSVFYTPEEVAHEAPHLALRSAMKTGRFEVDGHRIRKDGSRIWANTVLTALRDESGNPGGFVTITRDITERREAEDKIRRLNRVYAVLSGVNSLIVHVRDRQELFAGASRIALELGNFGMAWIGMLDPKTLAVIPAAWAGIDSDFIARSRNTARADAPMGQGLLGRAIRENRVVFSNDITAESTAGGERRKEAVRRGYHSLIVLPLTMSGAVVGSFTLFAKERNFFDDDEIKLLTGLAADISFALEHIESQKRIGTLSRTRAVSSGINSTIVHARSSQELFERACRIAVEEGKFGLAWIGTYDSTDMEVTPVAWAGVGSEDLPEHRATARADVPEGQGTIGPAIREGRPVFSNDISAQPNKGGSHRRKMERLGYHSVICLPLSTENAVTAILVLYAAELDFFTEEEVKLLSELADNISFALDHIAKQQHLEKLSRIRSVSGEINAAIVRIRERDALLRETCRIAVEHGKFGLVWVGLFDHDKQRVEPVAWSGFSPATARALSWATIDHPEFALHEALKTRKLAVRNDISQEPHAGTLREEAMRMGYRSAVCLPFVVGDQVMAAMNIFAEGAGFFDTDEIALLTEVAGDISFALEHIGKEEKLHYLAYHDPLTSLPNRRTLQERLGETLHAAQAASQRVAILFCDINRFRYINDTFGRHAGDAVLQQLAGRLKASWPDAKDVARVGSNRFAGMLRQVKDATDIAHLLQERVAPGLQASFVIDGSQIGVSLTVGIAVFPNDGNDNETLLRNAEAALIEAKRTGQRYLFYEPAMNASIAQKLLLENKLRRALDAEQFMLHYQPKVDLAGGRVVGLEALIRWNDPDSGLVSPAQFIPLLEETGMILEAGRWAIRQALADFRDWSRLGLQPPRIAVNVSSIQLKRADFAEIVGTEIRESGTTADGLELEITESLIMDDMEGNIDKLRELRAMGINVAIDDFGTGYSSLGYLTRLPVTALKIDRSFIISMTDNADSMTIVSTIISLAHSLNLNVVAEGVESEEQEKLLRLLRCDEVQGFRYGRPIPADEMLKRLQQQMVGNHER